MPVYRHVNLNILIDHKPGQARGIGMPDLARLGLQRAYEAMWDLWPWWGEGMLPILDKVCFADVLGDEPVYASHDEYRAATLEVDQTFVTGDWRRWRDEWGIKSVGAVWWFGPEVRYGPKVHHLQSQGWPARGRFRTILDPATRITTTVHWKALVYLEENARSQVLLDGQVCFAEREWWHKGPRRVTRPDGAVIEVAEEDLNHVADQPVGEPMIFQKRLCHLKWTTRPYALVYDPEVGADRKVPCRSLRPIMTP